MAVRHSSKPSKWLTNLPYHLLEAVVTYLPPQDVIRFRRISRDTYQTLTQDALCIKLLNDSFPHCKEANILRDLVEKNCRAEMEATDWKTVLDTVVRRYKHSFPKNFELDLRPHSLEKIPQSPPTPRIRGVTPFEQWFVSPDTHVDGDVPETAPWRSEEPTWTYSPERGLLVYPFPGKGGPILKALDLQTGKKVRVPFQIEGKIVRRIRLAHDILIVEWCFDQPSSPTNFFEPMFKHSVTAFDVILSSPGNGQLPLKQGHDHPTWRITFRAEWQLSEPKLPLGLQDRFFSVHNKTHYAVWIWRWREVPGRAEHGEQSQQALFIWELDQPANRRTTARRVVQSATASGAHLLQVLRGASLCHLGLHQHGNPSIFSLHIDANTWDTHSQSACGQVFAHTEIHGHAIGRHGPPIRGNFHHLWSIGIPILGHGPSWNDECLDAPVIDEEVRWEMGDPMADWEEHFELRAKQITGCSIPRPDILLDYHHKMRTWPGWAPCWRHANRGICIVSDVFDPDAEIRFTVSRDYFGDSLRVHKWQSENLEEVTGNHSLNLDESDDELEWQDIQIQVEHFWDIESGRSLPCAHSHVLQAKQYICGDERRLVGEDCVGNITVMTF